jgi:hypothetical protein
VANNRLPPALKSGKRLADFGDRLLRSRGIDHDDIGRVADHQP